jgi:TolA-binding protein
VAARTGAMMGRIGAAPDESQAYTPDHDMGMPADDMPPLDAMAHDIGDLPPPGDFDMPMPDDFGGSGGGGGKSAADYFNEGLSAFAGHQFDAALSAYQQALEAEGATDTPMHEKILYELGRTFMKKSDGKAAVEKFSELLKTHPQGAFRKKAMIGLAEIYERARDTARAVQFYEKAARIPPQDKEANIAQQKANQLRGQK